MTLSHLLLSLPTFAFQSPAMITISFFGMSSSVVSSSSAFFEEEAVDRYLYAWVRTGEDR